MPNEHVNKVIYGGQTLIDLTGDDVTASDVLSGKKFHLPSGAQGTGSCTYDANTSDATAVAAEILTGKTAYKNGSKLTGTMPNRGSVAGTISAKAGKYTIPQGYHDGSGSVQIASTEQAKLIPTNIREGVTVLGVEGTMSGSEGVKATSVNVTPYTTAQTIVPSDLGDYNSITQVNVSAIAYTETDNAAGGKTVTIGTVAA
ncbi:MAG: hypothetical protein J6N19_16985 [Clostridium sp.]|nr:hypothetical protein [Clostridium sp.]